MALSVRMPPLLEKQLELAASRQGITKSQFIISAVERALGQKDPATIYLQVREEAESYDVGEGRRDAHQPAHKMALRKSMRAAHERQQDEYAAYLIKRKSATKDPQ